MLVQYYYSMSEENTSIFIVTEKKKDKKKLFTRFPSLLLSFTYFDQNHTGYLLDKDIEEIIHTIGLQLSRAQVCLLICI